MLPIKTITSVLKVSTNIIGLTDIPAIMSFSTFITAVILSLSIVTLHS